VSLQSAGIVCAKITIAYYIKIAWHKEIGICDVSLQMHELF